MKKKQNAGAQNKASKAKNCGREQDCGKQSPKNCD